MDCYASTHTTHNKESSLMKKIGNTQSGTLLGEMTDAEYVKFAAGEATWSRSGCLAV